MWFGVVEGSKTFSIQTLVFTMEVISMFDLGVVVKKVGTMEEPEKFLDPPVEESKFGVMGQLEISL